MYSNWSTYKLMQQKTQSAAGIKIAVIGMSALEDTDRTQGLFRGASIIRLWDSIELGAENSMWMLTKKGCEQWAK